MRIYINKASCRFAKVGFSRRNAKARCAKIIFTDVRTANAKIAKAKVVKTNPAETIATTFDSAKASRSKTKCRRATLA